MDMRKVFQHREWGIAGAGVAFILLSISGSILLNCGTPLLQGCPIATSECGLEVAHRCALGGVPFILLGYIPLHFLADIMELMIEDFYLYVLLSSIDAMIVGFFLGEAIGRGK